MSHGVPHWPHCPPHRFRYLSPRSVAFPPRTLSDLTAEPSEPPIDRDALLHRVFPGDSELAQLSREKDWATTPLGPIETWPESLRTTASMVVTCPFGMMLAWGPEMTQIYNDKYRELMGAKHPEGLGMSVWDCWPEVWDELKPLFDKVHAGGRVEMIDMRLVLNRLPDPEEGFFTFTYSPIRVEDGSVGGVLDVVVETTDVVAARRVQEERDALFEELEVERARLAYIFQQSPTFLAVLRGREHRFELVNDAYLALVGKRDIVGKPMEEALPEIRDQGFIQLLDEVLETGEPFIGREVPVTLARTRGQAPETRYVDFTYLPLTSAGGPATGVIAHGVDITEQVLARREVERLLESSEQARREAEESRAEAERANRSKTDFLSAMSHELRTPLNAIGGYADLLALGIHGPMSEEQISAIERITAGQQHLLILINDILSYARLEAGRLEFDLRSLSAAQLLRSVEPLILPQAASRNLELNVVDPDAEIRLRGDEERVRQILLNLATNAVKFTDPGGSITLSAEADDDHVYLRVADTGQGISPEDQKVIFDAFRQVGRTLNEPRDGVGLGLAISRDLAYAMDGDLVVESELDVGSTFTLRLPRSG